MLTSASTLQRKILYKTSEIASFRSNAVLLFYHIFRPVVAWFLQFCWRRVTLNNAIIWLSKSGNHLVQLWTVGRHRSELSEEMTLRILIAAAGLCCTHDAAVHCPAVLSSATCLIAANICEIVGYPSNTVSLSSYSRLEEQRLSFLTRRPTLWETSRTLSLCVTDGPMPSTLPFLVLFGA